MRLCKQTVGCFIRLIQSAITLAMERSIKTSTGIQSRLFIKRIRVTASLSDLILCDFYKYYYYYKCYSFFRHLQGDENLRNKTAKSANVNRKLTIPNDRNSSIA